MFLPEPIVNNLLRGFDPKGIVMYVLSRSIGYVYVGTHRVCIDLLYLCIVSARTVAKI